MVAVMAMVNPFVRIAESGNFRIFDAPDINQI